MDRCGGGPKSKDFWPTIKPFLSSKQQAKGSNEIILQIDDNLISNQAEVRNTFKWLLCPYC